ncbi:MAG: tetraacyldisaccharide 4'-kinase, partial [Sphingobacteriaceae bacterium]
LFPISILYGLAVALRNLLFDLGLFKSKKFNIPVLVIGNITVGGSGKSPMTEYIVKLLKNEFSLAVLSRGYGRKTTGFRWVEPQSLATEVGDEPMQFKQHFPELTVAVCEDRVAGMQKLAPTHDLVVLDDAYQHRWLLPSLSILLLEYSSLQKVDFLLPSGNLREPRSATKRANILVVTKAPQNLSAEEKLNLVKYIQPQPNQNLFFSYLRYGNLLNFTDGSSRALSTLSVDTQVFLLTGIANAKALLAELNRYTAQIKHHKYLDHYRFSVADIEKISREYAESTATDKVIITTEKDAQRLKNSIFAAYLANTLIYVLPVETAFAEEDKKNFDALIHTHVREYRKHSSLFTEKNR